MVAACTARPASLPSATDNRGNSVFDRIAVVSRAVDANRVSLDSAIHAVHRISGDTSSRTVARSRELRKRAMSLDSIYRASVAELSSVVNAATKGVEPGARRFPVAIAPTPFIHGFADGANWMLRSPLVHEIGRNSAFVVIIPRGFVSDLASIPAPLQVLRGRLPNSARYTNASLVHDYLYWRQDCTRAQADNIMAIAMIEAGVPVLERRLIHEGVRQFGQSAWDGNRRARESGLIRTVAPPDDQVPPTGTWAEYREWLRSNRAAEGIEFKVPASVCSAGDSAKVPD